MKLALLSAVLITFLLAFSQTTYAQIGTITPPSSVPTTSGDPSNFVGTLIRNAITLTVVIAFVVFFFWTLFAGYKFVFSGGDPKGVSGAWNQIMWGVIGMVVVLSAFAIIRMVETFFNVDIVRNFQLPGS